MGTKLVSFGVGFAVNLVEDQLGTKISFVWIGCEWENHMHTPKTEKDILSLLSLRLFLSHTLPLSENVRTTHIFTQKLAYRGFGGYHCTPRVHTSRVVPVSCKGNFEKP